MVSMASLDVIPFIQIHADLILIFLPPPFVTLRPACSAGLQRSGPKMGRSMRAEISEEVIRGETKKANPGRNQRRRRTVPSCCVRLFGSCSLLPLEINFKGENFFKFYAEPDVKKLWLFI